MMPAVAVAAAAAPAERSASSVSDCSDCSHCAKRSTVRSRAGVRVSVNLRQFFSDQRARAFMWAPYGRCVQWLGRRIARVFGLPDDIALMSRGHMLAVTEPLLMLERDDPVEVVKMSYVFTPHDNQHDANVVSQRATDEASVRRGRAGALVRPTQSDVAIKRETCGQFPTSSRGDNLHNDAGDAEPTAGLPENQSVDESADLQQLKQNALRLLDERCQMSHESSPPKRLRRRRRRRKPQAAADAADAADASDDDYEPRPGDAAARPDAGGAAVLRNGCGSRPPRLVRPISPPPALQNGL